MGFLKSLFGGSDNKNQTVKLTPEEAKLKAIRKAIYNLEHREDLTLRNIESEIIKETNLNGVFRELLPDDEFYEEPKQYQHPQYGTGYSGADGMFAFDSGGILTFLILRDIKSLVKDGRDRPIRLRCIQEDMTKNRAKKDKYDIISAGMESLIRSCGNLTLNNIEGEIIKYTKLNGEFKALTPSDKEYRPLKITPIDAGGFTIYSYFGVNYIFNALSGEKIELCITEYDKNVALNNNLKEQKIEVRSYFISTDVPTK
jgi:hypothetical protein